MPDLAIALVAGLAGFALGYGVREFISRSPWIRGAPQSGFATLCVPKTQTRTYW
jgi:hypothetical protein